MTTNSLSTATRNLTIERVRFCAEEVERQRRGPIQVWWMVDAWETARSDYAEALRANWRVQMQPPFTLAQVQDWAHWIEREKNERARWRSGFVRIGEHVAPHPAELEQRMINWTKHLPDMTPNEAYIEFETIHPFIDGNGRTGKIIFNWLNGTLDTPVLPKVPNSWGIP